MKYQGLELDGFQEDSVRAIDNEESFIVAAPTGCGKTLIAEYAVEVSLKKNMRVIYTAPIKALSNQKFRDFKERFGDEIVGIQTGDVTINPQAQLLIMTTEIFRNLILERSDRLNDVYYTIFDEIHYLDDEERGTVWEESIILAPQKIKFMCLSATVPNVLELADWMSNIRGTEFKVIIEKKRPVPLEHILYSPYYGKISLKGIRKKYKRNFSERKKFISKRPSCRKIIRYVMNQNHIPVLYFCFRRKACERNAEMHSRVNLLSSEEQKNADILINELVSHYNLEDYYRIDKFRDLWRVGVAFHHAGILPAAKEIVERLFNAGFIKLLFCTETFALGVNMPARSVIFDELERFDGVGFSYLTTRQYNQMSGRAGRRGMDKMGYVYSQVIPEATDPRQIERILYAKNEKIKSRFSACYSTILNLYSQLGEDAFLMFRKSFRNYRQGGFSLSKSYKKEEEQIRSRILFLQNDGFLDGNNLTKKGKIAASVSGYEIQTAELFDKRSFDRCTVQELVVILGAVVTEENTKRKPVTVSDIRLKFEAEKVIKNLRKREMKFGIKNPISELDFTFAAPILSWANGGTIQDLLSFGVPEGDLIRLLRMTVQLLRTLHDIIDDPVIADKLHEALVLINRGVVDAQSELE